MHLTVEVCSEELLLCPERAVVWPAHSALIVADTHFGKDDVFRRSGIALPRGTTVDDLQRLTRLLEAHRLERLIVLGDFLHAATREGDSFPPTFAAWRREHRQLSIDVVAGNHDRGEISRKWRDSLQWHTEPLIESPFVLTHVPKAHPEGYALAGHIHPALRLPGTRRSLRVPVFWQGAHVLVLPAFGTFTGGTDVLAAAGDRLYAAGPERVIQLATLAPGHSPPQ